MKNPLVTIITPSYNQGEFIEETIESILNQTYTNIEYIIVDGKSNDETSFILDKYRDKIDIIIQEPDKGQSDAITKGFKLANGELVGWVNSDDILYSDCVEKIVQLYQNNPNGVIYYSEILDQIDRESKKFHTCTTTIEDRDTLLNKNYNVVQMGSFYKKDILKKVNYVNESIYYSMDLDLWLRLLNHGNIYRYSDKPLSAFRIWEGTKTTNGGFKFLNDIQKTLLRNGASYLSNNILKIQWYKLKLFIKKFFFPQKGE